MEQTGLCYRDAPAATPLPEETAALNSSAATNQNFSRLEREASKKLELSRRISSRDLSKATRRKTCHRLSAPRVRNGKRGRRRLQIRMVQRVESVDPELEVKPLKDRKRP
jgi:hypothetical protein